MWLKTFLSCSGHDCFDNNIFVNNFKKGIVEHVSYKNLSIEQRPEVIEVFEKLILLIKPSRVIEIGTFAGGLTLIIRDLLDHTDQKESIVYTYDVSEAIWLKQQILDRNIKNIYVNTCNLFNDSYQDIRNITVESDIKNIIQSDGVTLLLCDGGCKKCEFNILSKYLKTNDIIMTHDYAPNTEYFEQHMKNKIWNWHEIQDSDIIESCQKYGLVSYMKEEFLTAAWACFKKE